MALTIRWDITNRCNLRCRHCASNSEVSHEGELNTGQAFDVVDQLAANHVGMVKLLGGEPLVRADLLPIMERLCERKIAVGITTNGTIPFTGKLLDFIARNELSYVTFSVDGVSDEINATLRPSKTLALIEENFALLCEVRDKYNLALKVSIICVLNKANFRHVDEMFRFAKKYSVHKIAFTNLVPRGRAEDLHDLICTPSDLLQISDQIAQSIQQFPQIVIEPSFAPALVMDYSRVALGKTFPVTNYACNAGTELGYIDSTGKLYPCESIVEKFAFRNNSLLEKTFREVWHMQEFDAFYEAVEQGRGYRSSCCIGCKYRYTYCYPCIAWSMKPDICQEILEQYPDLNR